MRKCRRVVELNCVSLVEKEPIPFGANAQPIAINDDHNKSLIGLEATATGWGALTQGGSAPNQLNAVQMPVITQAESNYTTNLRYNDDLMMIAGRPGEGKDTCKGDSGGPLALTKYGQPILVGITSWGTGCGWSGVYTRVSKYPDWIKSKAEPVA